MIKKIRIFSLLLVLLASQTLKAQTVEGYVTNNNEIPIKGAIVKLQSKQSGIRTNNDGYFQLHAEQKDSVLDVIFPGMKKATVKISHQNTINIILYPEVTNRENNEATPKPMKAAFRTPTKTITSGIMIQADNTIPFNYNTEDYSSVEESGFRPVASSPFSTFAADVDRASYSNIRRFINNGQLPPKGAVRVEEMINYFNYQYKEPNIDDPLAISISKSGCPWNKQHELISIGIQAKNIATADLPHANMVFLIDVSGSMSAQNKLPLVKSSLKMLVNQLRPSDKIAIVTYAGAANIALTATAGSNKEKIVSCIDQLSAGGSTAGGAGLTMAYKIASENFLKEGNNRIIMATDGDFNVGESSDASMQKMVEQQRDHGIYLSVLGFGTGNYKDNKLELVADKGNGNYAYIDNSKEAHKMLIEEYGGTLYTLAKDVKIQVEFNPLHVKEYRLIGYENRALNEEDFNNTEKDAGEIGAGHQVTALYEIVPAHATSTTTSTVSKYQTTKPVNDENLKNELLTVKINYTDPETLKHKTISAIGKKHALANNDAIAFAAVVAQFGMMLNNSDYLKENSLEQLIERAYKLRGTDKNGSKAEFIQLMETAKSLGLEQ